jgi:hypothetical protein
VTVETLHVSATVVLNDFDGRLTIGLHGLARGSFDALCKPASVTQHERDGSERWWSGTVRQSKTLAVHAYTREPPPDGTGLA